MNRLDVHKAIQAVGVVLRRQSKAASKLRVLKLLYIADRECLRRTGSPILGSKIVAMQHGPLHSELLDLINGNHLSEPEWSNYFKTMGILVILENEPGVGKLSRREIELLNETVDARAGLDDYDVAEETHRFHEWIKNYPNRDEKTSRPISIGDLLDAVGRTQDKEVILQDLNDEAAFSRFFSGMSR